MFDLVMPALELECCLNEAEALEQRLDALVELAWEPGWTAPALARLIALCAQLQQHQDGADWPALRDRLRRHPIRRLMHEDPFTRQAFEAKGAQASLPALLELMLRRPAAMAQLSQTSRAGRDLFATTTELRYPAALRARTRHLACIIEAVVDRRPGAEVLTLEAGLLPEAWEMEPGRRLGRWLAVNGQLSMHQALRATLPPGLPLKARHGSLAGLVRRPYRHGVFDLVILAELPAEASTAQLRDLVDAAFAAVKPGGLLVLGCAAEAPPEAAWMDAFMDWRPHWREPEELEALLCVVPRAELARREVSRSLDGRLLRAQLRKRGPGVG